MRKATEVAGNRRIASLGIAGVLAFHAPAAAQVQLVPVASGLASPVFVAGAHDGTRRLFIVEQAGVIRDGRDWGQIFTFDIRLRQKPARRSLLLIFC